MKREERRSKMTEGGPGLGAHFSYNGLYREAHQGNLFQASGKGRVFIS